MNNQQSENGSVSVRVEPVAIVAAMSEEIRPIRDRLEQKVSRSVGSAYAIEGRLAGRRTIAIVTGEGADSGAAGLRRFLDEEKVSVVIVVGVSGGLAPSLGSGDIVVCRNVQGPSGRVFEMDPHLFERAAAVSGAVVGSGLSSDRIITTVEEKHQLWTEGGSIPNQVVDLESAAFCEVASDYDVPALVVRAVSDSASESLPIDFNRFRDPRGGVDRSKVLRETVLHPTLMPKLLRLRDRVRSGAVALERVVIEVIGS